MSMKDFAVERSLAHLAFKIGQKAGVKRLETAAYELAETIQNYQIEFKALLNGKNPFWAETTIPFQEPFYDVRAPRYASLSEPHFSYGIVIDDSPNAPDFLASVYVSDWDTDDHGDFVKATVRMGMFNPVLATTAELTGRIHCVFQGYSAPQDSDPGDLGQMQ